jgi:hypothetical protein
MFANGAEIHVMRRILRIPRGETEPGMPRPYDRIFWLKEPNLHMKRPSPRDGESAFKREQSRIKNLTPTLGLRTMVLLLASTGRQKLTEK